MKKSTDVLLKVLIGIFATVFLISTSILIYFRITDERAEKNIEKLQEDVHQQDSVDSDQPSDSEIARQNLLASYQKLYAENNDFVGWIRIDGTVIDYPVMQHPQEKDYYLHRDFYGDYSASGTPFVQEDCDVFTPSDNVIIHGHHLKDGKMFTTLLQYKYIDYWKEHPTIVFNTREGLCTYSVLGCFVVQVNTGDDPFKYYEFINAASENEFNQFVNTVKEYAYYDTGISAQYGDKLLTLSTCDYVMDDCRCVVVAVRNQEETNE